MTTEVNKEILLLLREEFKILQSTMQVLAIDLARIEERIGATQRLEKAIESMKIKMEEIDRAIVALEGGKVDILEIKDKLSENVNKIEDLALSRAKIAGYIAGAGAVAGGIVKLLSG